MGLVLFTHHYRLEHPEAALIEVVRGLGYHADLEEDPGVPEPLHETTSYWEARIPGLIASLDRTAASVVRDGALRDEAPLQPANPRVAEVDAPVAVEGYTRADGRFVRGYTRRR